MSVRIGSNIASLGAQRKLAENTSTLAGVFERLSSGQRINRASDDAAGLAIADSLNAASRIFVQAVRNLNDGVSLFNIADSAIETLSSIMIRLEELAEQAANGTYGNQQRKALDAEAQALSKEFFRISKTTTFNGIGLLGGTFDQVNVQAGFGESSVLSGGVGGAIGTGSFGGATQYSVGNNPLSIASGDLNGDGVLDFVTANNGLDTVSVLLGTGNGEFAAQVQYSTGNEPRSVALGDFNGDGVLDIVTADDGPPGTVSVMLGIGDGTFSPRTSYSAGNSLTSVTTGDFNGDGKLDLVATDNGTDTARVLLGNGDGTFSQPVSYATGDAPRSVSTGDFNGDGAIDIVTADAGTDTVSVLLGNGDGTFAARVSYSTGDVPQAVATGDLNGDGVLDLVVADYQDNTVSVLLGTGDGTFSARVSYSTGSDPVSVATGDFNGDGVLDLVTADYLSGTVSVLQGRGDGTFSAAVSYASGNALASVATGDFNGDGVVDIVTADYGNSAAGVLLGNTKDGVAPLLPFSLKTLADARQALPVFKQKRDQLAAQRGQVGAFQSRISVAVNVLQVSSENFRAAESRIRDADIAGETSRLLRLNILQQAASAVLAQANQQPALAIALLSPRLSAN